MVPSGCLITASSSHPSAFYLFFLPFHRHAHASYLHTAHVRSSKITPVSPEKTPRFAEKYSPFRTFRFPFRTSRSRFAGFFFLIGVQTKNTIRKELRFVVWWSTARTLPCNAIPEPKWRNFSAKRELRLPASHAKRGSRFAVRSNPPFRRVVTPGCASANRPGKLSCLCCSGGWIV